MKKLLLSWWTQICLWFAKEKPTEPIQPCEADADYVTTDFDTQLVTLINNFRIKNGLNSLSLSRLMIEIAATHSKYMTDKGKMSHDYAPERSAWFNGSVLTENVAYGYSTANSFLAAWEKSEPHKKNMLCKADFIGLATAVGNDGHKYVTVLFLKY